MSLLDRIRGTESRIQSKGLKPKSTTCECMATAFKVKLKVNQVVGYHVPFWRKVLETLPLTQAASSGTSLNSTTHRVEFLESSP